MVMGLCPAARAAASEQPQLATERFGRRAGNFPFFFVRCCRCTLLREERDHVQTIENTSWPFAFSIFSLNFRTCSFQGVDVAATYLKSLGSSPASSPTYFLSTSAPYAATRSSAACPPDREPGNPP